MLIKNRRFTLNLGLLLSISFLSVQNPVGASPYGQGVFGANVPFGSSTSLSISLGNNVTVNLNPSGPIFTGSGSHTVTVTSTDVIGYRLYASSPLSTAMALVGGSDSIPASTNSVGGTLAVNTWGYNTDGSANYLGMLSAPSIIKDANGPFTSGDSTTVTYSALTDITKSAGTYTVPVVYTVAAKNP